MLMVPSLSHVTTHFVHLDRIAVRLDRPNNILNNAYCSLCSSGYELSRALAVATHANCIALAIADANSYRQAGFRCAGNRKHT